MKNRHFSRCCIVTNLLIFASLIPASGKCKAANSVALVVDRATLSADGEQIERYAASIRNEGKETIVIGMEEGMSPDAIRDTLRYLFRNRRLEGAVLIGDVPIPMIRRAHHLATAFKMNPAMPWNRSSIPSDRFYDDFGLAFTFLKQDEKNPSLWYYDLSPAGDQHVRCDIYSARIKPSKSDPEHSFHDLIAEFLDRAATAKAGRERLDNVFHYGGHGNSSESFNARIDEDRAFYEQFGFSAPDERVHYLNFDEDGYVKNRFREILADPELDLAHIHSHGAVETQYLSKQPYAFLTTDHLEYVKADLRGRMRSARDTARTKAAIIRDLGVPANWLDNFNDPEIARKDSIRSASVDNMLEDMEGYTSGVKVLLLDACFNGAFLHDDYMASEYAFGHGSSTLAVLGNSVNIIQDHWKNELMGLLSYGVSVGNWAKQNQTLESHIFGDPTFAFAAKPSGFKDLDAIVAFPTVRDARRMLPSPVPDICAYGMKVLAATGYLADDALLHALREDPRINVRMEAFSSLVRRRSDALETAIAQGLEDPYELIRRMAARYAENNGSPALLESVVRHYLDPFETSRVRYHLVNAMSQYRFGEVKKTFDAEYARRKGIWPDRATYDAILGRIGRSIQSDSTDFAALADPSVPVKERRFTVNGQRNACVPAAVEPMLRVIGSDDDEDLRARAAECLGWYVYSWRRNEILQDCRALADKIDNPVVKDELVRTVARLSGQ